MRFILQVAVGDILKFDFVVEGAESIARLLGRYSIFEDVYLRRTSKASKEPEDSLVEMYSTILMYRSKAKSFFDQSSPGRILRSAFVTEDECENLTKRMDLEQSNVDIVALLSWMHIIKTISATLWRNFQSVNTRSMQGSWSSSTP